MGVQHLQIILSEEGMIKIYIRLWFGLQRAVTTSWQGKQVCWAEHS